MLFSNLLVTVALGTAVSARAIEKKSDASSQKPLEAPQTCAFAPSTPLPTSFTSTLPASLHTYLSAILLSHFTSPHPAPQFSSSAPMISTLSLAEETGDPSLQGIFLGLVYTSKTATPHSGPPPSSALPKHQESSSPEAEPIKKEEEQDGDKSWGHLNNHEMRSPLPMLPVPQVQPTPEMQTCYREAVEDVKENKLVEGTLVFPGDAGKMRFLVWRVD